MNPAGVVTALAAILVMTRIGARVARHLGQPTVVGEMAAAIVAGGMVLGTSAQGHAAVPALQTAGTEGVVLYLACVARRLRISVDVLMTAGRLAGAAACAALIGAAAVAGAVDLAPGGHVGQMAAMLVLAAALTSNGFPLVARLLEELPSVASLSQHTVLVTAAMLTSFSFAELEAARAQHRGAGGVAGGAATAAGHVALLVAAAAVIGVAARRRAGSSPTQATARLPATAEGVPPARVAYRQPSVRSTRACLYRSGMPAVFIGAVLLAGGAGTALTGSPLAASFLLGAALGPNLAASAVLDRVEGLARAWFVPVFLAAVSSHVALQALGPATVGESVLMTALLAVPPAVAVLVMSRRSGLSRISAFALLNCRGLVLVAVSGSAAADGLLSPRLGGVVIVAAFTTTALSAPIMAWDRRRHGRRLSDTEKKRSAPDPTVIPVAPDHDPRRPYRPCSERGQPVGCRTITDD